MANTNDGKIVKIDTWTSDIELFTVPITVKKIVLYSATAGDLFYVEDKNGNQIALVAQTVSATTTEMDFGDEGVRFNGLQVDVSDCTGLGAGDVAWIYLK